MTYEELKAKLDTLTRAQLASEVMWWGDERGGKIDDVFVLDEEWVSLEGEPMVQRSEIVAGEEAAITATLPKGTVVLITDEPKETPRAIAPAQPSTTSPAESV